MDTTIPTLDQIMDRNSLLGDIGGTIIFEAVEEAARSRTASAGAPAAAEILKKVFGAPWVARVQSVIPVDAYKYAATALAGVIQNRVDSMNDIDLETKLVLGKVVKPLTIGVGKGVSDAAQMNQIIDDAVAEVRTSNPAAPQTAVLDHYGVSVHVPGPHLIKWDPVTNDVARYPDGSPVILCSKLDEAMRRWKLDHPDTVRRVGSGRGARDESVSGAPFHLSFLLADDALEYVKDAECDCCGGHAKILKKKEVSVPVSFYARIGKKRRQFLYTLLQAAQRDPEVDPTSLTGVMDEVEKIDVDLLKDTIGQLRKVHRRNNGVIPTEDLNAWIQFVRSFGDGKLDADQWVSVEGRKAWRVLTNPNVSTPAWLRALVSFGIAVATSSGVAYLGLAVLGLAMFIPAFLFPWKETLEWWLLPGSVPAQDIWVYAWGAQLAIAVPLITFGLVFIFIFLALFRPLQENVNAVLRRIPILGANPGEWLVPTGKQILVWFAFGTLLGGGFLFMGLPTWYRLAQFLLTFAGIISYSLLQKMADDELVDLKKATPETRRSMVGFERLQKSSDLIYWIVNGLIAGLAVLGTMHFVFLRIGPFAVQYWASIVAMPPFTQLAGMPTNVFNTIIGLVSGWGGTVAAWSGLLGMFVLTVLTLTFLIPAGLRRIEEKERTLKALFATFTVGSLAVLWLIFVGMAASGPAAQAASWTGSTVQQTATWVGNAMSGPVVSTTFAPAPAPSTAKAAPRARATSPRASSSAPDAAFLRLCASTPSQEGKQALGCP